MDVKLLLVLLTFCSNANSQNVCRDRYRPVMAEILDKFELVDVLRNDNVTLDCSFCGEFDDGQAKNWFKANQPGDDPKELVADMENDMTLNRIVVNGDHSLSIYNISANDSAMYYCKLFEAKEIETNYNYFIDIVENIKSDIEVGNQTALKKYFEEYFFPINKLFAESKGPEFVQARDRLNITMELMTHWEKWGKCLCDKPGGKRIKKKRGTCRIKLRNNSTKIIPGDSNKVFFLKIHEISCKSLRLKNIFPDINNRTKVIPDFIQMENCHETCSLDDNGENRGWKLGKTKEYKYRKTYVLFKKSHLTLVCPESTLENKVVWQKLGKVLKPGVNDYPHMYVDTFNTLYLVNVTSAEEGNFTCQVDDIQMLRFIVKVVAKSVFFSGILARHLGYLGFILVLTIPCYVGGLIITFLRRKSFEKYQEYLEEESDDSQEEKTDTDDNDDDDDDDDSFNEYDTLL